MDIKISMVDYYNLRFGYCDDNSESDFIDNINRKLNIHIANGYDEQKNQFLLIFHNGKFLSKSDSSLLDNLDMIVGAQDFRFIGGSFGAASGEAFIAGIQNAIDNKIPLNL